MPSSPHYVRDLKRERETAKKRGETGVGPKSKDNLRHKARRKVEKRLGRKLRTDEHVDHKNGVGAGNGHKNLRVMSASKNCSLGGKKGDTKGKAEGARKGHKSRRLPVRKP